MFCHRYPTRVISSGHNGASSPKDGSLIVRSGCDCQLQSGREPGLSGKGNTCESLINVAKRHLTRAGSGATRPLIASFGGLQRRDV
jgi:hypothetical protein